MSRKISILLAESVALYLLLCPHAFAATEVSDEAKQQLVSQAESFRKEAKPPSLEEEEKPEIVVEEKEEPEPKEEGPKFFVKKIRLEGNTVFSEEDLRPLISPFENKEQSFASLANLSAAITNTYRAKGYLTSRAYIPPQKVENGTVTIKILEGKIDKIFVEANRFFKKSLYSKMIHLRKDRIFQYQDLESSLYFLNQQPDRKAKAYLIAGETPQTSDIILKADEKYPIHVYYEFNNRGTKLTHRARHTIHADNNNFSGNGDTFASSLGMAEEGAFTAASVNYDLPIEETGTDLGLSFSHVDTMLIGHLKPSEVKGQSISFTPSITQTLVKRPSLLFNIYLGFEIKDSKTLVDDIKINFDRSRVFVFGPRLTFQDTGGRTLLSSDAHWGIPDFLGSNEEVDPNASKTNSGGDFLYYTGSVARIQRIPPDSYLIVRGAGQWTKDTLSSLEQYRAGGAFTVRGYPESDSSGDYGFNASAELNMPVPFLPKDWEMPFNKKKWRDVVRLAGFVDGARTYIRERTNSVDVKDRFLLGLGFGIRVNIDSSVSFQADLGYPLGDKSTDENQKQVHISLRVGF